MSASVEASAATTTTFQLECRAVTASVEVVAATAGRDFDSNGYVVTVSLDGYSDNCRLSVGPGSVDVQLSVGELTRDVRRVAFEITCQAPTEDVRLTTTTGAAPVIPTDTPSWWTTLSSRLPAAPTIPTICTRDPLRLAGDDSYLVPALSPSDHRFELTDIHGNCTLDGRTRRTVSVAIGTVAEVAFNVVCGAP